VAARDPPASPFHSPHLLSKVERESRAYIGSSHIALPRFFD